MVGTTQESKESFKNCFLASWKGKKISLKKFGGHFKKPRWSIKTAANRLGNTVIDYLKGDNLLTTVGAAKFDSFGAKNNW